MADVGSIMETEADTKLSARIMHKAENMAESNRILASWTCSRHMAGINHTLPEAYRNMPS